jgi:N-acetylneuraminic acid mutarotase
MKRILRLIIPLSGLILAIMVVKTISVEAHTRDTPVTLNEDWTVRASLPIPIGFLGADSIDGKIYAAGGSSTFTDALDTLFSYDPMIDAWQALASLPSPRIDPGIITEGGKLYMAGGQGHTGNIIYGDLYVYTPNTNMWEKLADMPGSRTRGAMAAWQGKLFYVGGNDAAGKASDTVYEYDINMNTWTLLTTLPETRDLEGTAVVAGVLYVIGGMPPSGFVPSDIVWGYDLLQNSWSVKAPLPVAKMALNASTKSYNGKIYVVGGAYIAGMYSDVEVYDPQFNAWQFLPDLPKTGWVAAVISNGELHAIGGYSFHSGFMADHFALHLFIPPDKVTISGPGEGMVNKSYSFTANVIPITTSLPLTYTWQASGQVPITYTAGLTDTISFTWDVTGTQVITVTANNQFGLVTDNQMIMITAPLNHYLPLVTKIP